MKAKIFAVAAVMVTFGCAPAYQIAASLGGDLAGNLLKSATKPNTNKVVLNKEIERHQVGNHDIRMYDGTFQNSPSILLITKYNEQMGFLLQHLAVTFH